MFIIKVERHSNTSKPTGRYMRLRFHGKVMLFTDRAEAQKWADNFKSATVEYATAKDKREGTQEGK